VVVEGGHVVVVGEVRRDVARRIAAVGPVAPLLDEAREAVARRAGYFDLDVAVAAHVGVFAGANERAITAAGNFHLARENIDLGAAPSDVHAEEAAGRREDRGVIGVEAQGALARGDVAHVDGRRAAHEEQKVEVVVGLVGARHPLEAQLRVPVHPHDVSVGEHGLRARTDARDEAVPGEDRRIDPGRGVVVGLRDEGNVRLHV